MEYYSIGELAKRTNTSKKAIRYYQEEGMISPTYFEKSIYAFYTEKERVIIDRIVALKNFGIPIKEIKNIVKEDSKSVLINILSKQIGIIQNQISSLSDICDMLQKICEEMEYSEAFKWEQFIRAYKILNMNNQAFQQYAKENDLKSRIALHKYCSKNKTGWFPWLFNHYNLKDKDSILEIGCGNGELWLQNLDKINGKNYNIILTDISYGMIADAKSNLIDKINVDFKMIDMNHLIFENESQNVIIANHVLFYAENLDKSLEEITRVLSGDGVFYCSAYGAGHLKKIEDIVKQFDSRIYLSSIKLNEVFGLENAESILERHFSNITMDIYEDVLEVTSASLLYDYIMSCHGNQREMLKGKESLFMEYLERLIGLSGKISIEKQAGMYSCKK